MSFISSRDANVSGVKKPDDRPHIDIVSLANSTVLDSQGNGVKMATFWRHRPVIFVFLRHFACLACRAHAVQIWSQRGAYESKGARIVFIGNGQPNFIRTFIEDLKLDSAPIYTDPTLGVFRAAGFRRGFLAALGPKSLLNGWKMERAGATSGKYEEGTGDWWQLGGITAVQTSGKVSYHYISQVLGDHAPQDEVIEGSKESAST